MDDQNSGFPPMDEENMENEEMLNFSELDELGLSGIEYYTDGHFGENIGGEDIPFQLLDCDIDSQGGVHQGYHNVGMESHHLDMDIHGEPQQMIETSIQEHIVPNSSPPIQQQIYTSNQYETTDHTIYQTPITVAPPPVIEQHVIPEHDIQNMYDFQNSQPEEVVSPVQSQQEISIHDIHESIVTSDLVSIPMIEESVPSPEVITIDSSPERIPQHTPTVQSVVSVSVSDPQALSQSAPETIQTEIIQSHIVQPQTIQPQVIQTQAIQPQLIQPKAIQTQTIQTQVVPQPQQAIAGNAAVKYVPFQTSTSGHSGILPILSKSSIVSGTTGQTLLIQNNNSQPRFLFQTPQGPVLLQGGPGPASLPGSTQTVLVSSSQADTSKIVSPVLTSINSNLVQNIPKPTLVEQATQAQKSATGLVNKPIFLIGPTAVKPGSVSANMVSFTTQARSPSIAIRPSIKLQKIAPSPSKESALNKGSLQIGLQNNLKTSGLQFMVVDNNSETQPSASTNNPPKILTTNIPGVSKVIPLKSSKPQPMNLIQLVTNNNKTKNMLVHLSPNSNKFGTVVQPVSKPGLPPSNTPTRVLMNCSRPRAPTPTTTVIPTRIMGTSAAREQSFRTISGTDATISSSKMFSQTIRTTLNPGTPPFRVFNATNDDPRRKACNCNKSQCLKLYCECFANGEFCQNCNCVNCCNNLDNEEMRQKAIRFCLERNPNAFHPKIGQKSSDVTHKKGCNCKKSNCLKNYCECYEAKILCTDKCKCCGCKNFENSIERRVPSMGVGMTVSQHMAQHKMDLELESQKKIPAWEPNPDVKLPFKVSSDMNPFNLLTDEILDATACCLIAQREEAENEGQDSDSIQRLTLEMFGDCLNQMFNLDGTKKMKKAEGEVKFLQAKK